MAFYLSSINGGILMKLHGIKVPHKKNTANCVPVRLSVPETVRIPMSMHIGKPAKVAVKRGDTVKVGQLIGEADGFISAPVHSSVSGTVAKIEEMTLSNGAKGQCVVIDTDGEQTVFEGVKPPEVHDLQSFTEAVRQSGAVGLGGAGFPTFVKLSVKDLSKLDAVVINAAECEPYITSDTRTMLDKSDDIMRGIEAVKKYLQPNRFIIGIEKNKPEAIKKMQELASQSEGVEVKVLPSSYPQGGEKVLVFNTVGKIIPKGGLPLDVGVIVINVTTLAFIGNYLKTGAPIGMSIADLLEQSGGTKSEVAKALYGGPMMGLAVPSLDSPILKNTNAITAMDIKEATPPKTTPCIRCGACLNHCPLRLDPREIARAYKLGSVEDLQTLHVDLCMECGCCSYICPAHRPLVQTNKLAKALLRVNQAKKEGK